MGDSTTDPFFKDIDYHQPVVFLRDVLSSMVHRTTNDDVLDDKYAEDNYNWHDERPHKCLCSHWNYKLPSNSTGCYAGCACGCSCGKDHYLHLTTLQREYFKQVEKSGGFDIAVDYNGPFRTIIPMPPISEMDEEEQDFMKKLAVLAIKRYNKMKMRVAENEYYKCVQFIKATVAAAQGNALYHITFRATAGVADTETFQAKVFDASCSNGCHLRKVRLCRQRP